MDIVERLECGCNPGKVYASGSSFRKHFASNRHKAWEKDRKVEEKTSVAEDILARRIEKLQIDNLSLEKRVRELEETIFCMPNRRAVSYSRKKKVAASQGWTCLVCKSILSHVFEVDHIQPLFLGGSNSESNLQALCRECHGKKTLKDRETFLSRRNYFCSRENI